MRFFTNSLNFQILLRTSITQKIKLFHSGNGTKYINKNFSSYFKEKDILHQTICIHTPEQNDLSERKNVSKKIQTNISKKFWSEVVLAVVHLMNRLPSPVLKNKNPIEILKNRTINLITLGYLNAHILSISRGVISLIKPRLKRFFLDIPSNKMVINILIQSNKKNTYFSKCLVF
jgi:hypothetical protein